MDFLKTFGSSKLRVLKENTTWLWEITHGTIVITRET